MNIWRFGKLAPVGIWACLVQAGLSFSTVAFSEELGANKFDLELQYLPPPASSGLQGEGLTQVHLEMARKAIADARDAGFTFLRVAAAGFAPSDLALWQSDPNAFWSHVDSMFDDLDRANLRLIPSFFWNLAQLPALCHETVGNLVRSRDSCSRALGVHFVTEFIERYKNRKTILFYELTNEMNLHADIDMQRRECGKAKVDNNPCAWGNFSTDDMFTFSRDMVSVMKRLDAAHRIDSGYALPRPSAAHLRLRPEFGPTGADWTPDTQTEFSSLIRAIHEPFDIICIHIYPGPTGVRFGEPEGHEYETVAVVASAAKAAGKPLYVGEFGDTKKSPFISQMLEEILRDHIAYSSIWVWEFYQTSTFVTYNTEATRYNVEPGYSDEVIAELMATQSRMHGATVSEKPESLRVVLASPLPCASVDSPVELAALASDGARGVRSVEFLVDGKSVGVASTLPYVIKFNPANLGGRLVNVAARVAGADGRVTTASETVNVNHASQECEIGGK